MPIPDSQLQTWSNPGATHGSQNTYTSIKNALRSSFHMSGRPYDIYLQGSYANSTNIRADSDVDIVAELTSPEFHNPNPSRRYDSSAENTWRDFRNRVVRALQAQYGAHLVVSKNRCVRVNGSGGRLPADVVVCLRYRHSSRSYPSYATTSELGITFLDLDKKTWIYNFPKLHRDNGSAKNEYSRTRNNYKPTIRMFKNARNRLIDRGIISESTAPSYFVECLLYNVPDDKYLGGFGNRYIEILSSLVDSLSHNQGQTLICQNEQSSLFGPESTQWNVGDAAKLLSGLLDLWKNY